MVKGLIWQLVGTNEICESFITFVQTGVKRNYKKKTDIITVIPKKMYYVILSALGPKIGLIFGPYQCGVLQMYFYICLFYFRPLTTPSFTTGLSEAWADLSPSRSLAQSHIKPGLLSRFSFLSKRWHELCLIH